jgi:5-methylthioadenosine/S-adenosylhomocysteine deaminase
MQTVDTIINARWVLTVDADNRVCEDHAVVINRGQIAGVLPREEAAREYRADTVFNRPAHVLLPGFVNAHTHAAMTLLRGIADDCTLSDWLKNHISPAEMRWVGEEYVRDGTELAICEMLRGGTTCFSDMHLYPEVAASSAATIGIRANIGLIVVEFPTGWANDVDEYLAKCLTIHDDLKDDPLITTCFATYGANSASDETLTRIRTLADQLGLQFHIHLQETADEVAESIERYGKRPLSRLVDLGLVSASLMAAHLTQLDDEEIEIFSRTGAHVLHCPESNMKLASGVCPVARLREAGVNVALGTDGSASNNDLNMMGEMRSATLLGRIAANDPQAMTATQSLRMATINGARAMGLEDQIGSLEQGKNADIACIDMVHAASWPVYDPVSQIVYAAGRDQVSDVWIAGRQQLADGALTRVDENEIMERAAQWQQNIAVSRREPA